MKSHLMKDENSLLVDKARRLANFCYENRFDGIDVLMGVKISQMARIYDGIGPDFEASVVLKILGHINPLFEPAGFLQDIAYRLETDRSRENFHRVNLDFWHNCIRCVKLKYSFLNPKRYYLIWISARKLWGASDEYGWNTWLSRGKRQGGNNECF